MRVPSIIIGLFFSVAACFAQVPLPADTLLKMIKQYPKPDTNRVLLLNQLAFANYYSNPLNSLKYAYEARNISDSLNFTKGEAEALRQVGLAFWGQGDMSTAINYFLTALRIAKANRHLQVEANLLTNIGTAYNGQGNPTEALKFLEQSLAIQRQLANINREAVVLNNMGDSYLALKDFEKAKYAYRRAANIGRISNYLLALATNIRNLGNVNEAEGLYDSAMVKYQEALTYATQAKDTRGIILGHKSMASVFMAKGNYGKAREYLTISLEAAQKSNLRAYVRDCYEAFVRLNELQGNQAEAFKYLKLYTTYKDSLQNLRILSDIAADRLRYETEQKQSEIELLKKEGELNATQIKYQNSQIAIISGSLLISVMLLIIAIVNYRKMRSRNMLLEQSQLKIEKQNKLLAEQGDEMNALNQQLKAQQLQVVEQRDELVGKNNEIELMNKKVLEVNQNLEKIVALRTQVLLDQNKRLTDYSYFNAHQLRSPVASILGLVNLLQHTSTPQDHLELIRNLEISAKRLDEAIRSINNSLQDGIHKDE
jgi:tetratricopeptide (TPR) repeat protein